MALKAPTIVIFDMDGTSVRHVNPALLHILEWLDDTSFRMRKFTASFLRRNKTPLSVEIDDLIPKKTPRLLVHRALHKVRRKPVEQIVEPCPGIYSVLALLKKYNVPMGLTSNGLGKGYGHDILQKFDIEKYFRATIFREDIKRSKPNPEPILLTLQMMDVKLSANDVIWYIGDRHKDVTAALAAQQHLPCPIVPIAYGVNAAVAVLEKQVGPDHIIMSYHDMYWKLERLLGAETKAYSTFINS